MKTLLSASILSVAAALPAFAEPQGNLLTILTAPEPQTQLMAMVLTMSAVQEGANAQILLCGPAADIALKEAPESATAGQPPRDASPQGLMRKMMTEHNVKVEVCAIYLPGLGADASVLIDGVTAATPDVAGRTILAEDTAIISF